MLDSGRAGLPDDEMPFTMEVLAIPAAILVLLHATACGGVDASDEWTSGPATNCSTQYPNAARDMAVFATTGEGSEGMKCYLSCLYQARGLMKSDGTMIRPATKDVPPSIILTLEPCFALVPSADLCETAFQYVKCVRDKEKILQAQVGN